MGNSKMAVAAYAGERAAPQANKKTLLGGVVRQCEACAPADSGCDDRRWHTCKEVAVCVLWAAEIAGFVGSCGSCLYTKGP